MQLAQLRVAGRIVLDRFVKADRSDVRRPGRVVQAPVVDVVDHLVVGQILVRHVEMLRDKAQHTETVVLRRPLRAGEILRVHLEEARDMDAARRVVDATVAFVGEELARCRTQRAPQSVAGVRRRTQRGTAVRAAVDGEVDARLGELAAQDLVLDVVEADRASAGEMAAALKELTVARLPYRARSDTPP